ncbi:hypothetical protein LSE82_004878 [Salmonella enterica]|nr:hypothetical protein [Salmonella enterica]
MKKHNISLMKRGILLSLILMSPEILAAEKSENLNFHYTKGTADGVGRIGQQVRACRSLTDPITVKFVLDNVDSRNEQINLKINGKDIKSIIEPFRESASFIHPFTLSSSSKISGIWGVMKETQPDYYDKLTEKKEPYCFDSRRQVRPDAVVPFGLLSIPYTGDTFSPWCYYPKRIIDGPVYNNEKPLSEAPEEVQYAVRNGNKQYFFDHIFYKKGVYTKVPVPGSSHPIRQEFRFDGPFDEVSNAGELDYTLPYEHSSDATDTRLSGFMDLHLSQRNIQSVELTILRKKDKKAISFRWSRFDTGSEAHTNILRLKLSGDTGLVKPASGQSDAEDMYLNNGFYAPYKTKTAPNTFYRGTLVSYNGLNDKYTSHTPLLSLPASIEGDINLVNTDSITLELKRDDTGNYMAWFYGQPLQFSDVIFAGKMVATAKTVRDECY